MADLGVKGLALSLDGPTAEIHDGFRCQPGSFAWTLNGIKLARAHGLPVQINTTVTRRNRELLPAVAALIEDLGATMWSVFFLVTVGRAQQADQLDAEECEEVFAFLDQLARDKPFGVRTTAAPHYRRFVLQRRTSEKRNGKPPTAERPVAGMVEGTVEGLPRAPRGVTDGNGIVFISHTGEVYPSGFLPLCAGDVRQTPLSEIYRDAPLFRRLRDHSRLLGKCGVCEYRKVCGGSRARAYAVYGDAMAEEPLCAYEPPRSMPEARSTESPTP
jgi:radical SAM protein with 4Fe4S-binding SPASM domain